MFQQANISQHHKIFWQVFFGLATVLATFFKTWGIFPPNFLDKTVTDLQLRIGCMHDEH